MIDSHGKTPKKPVIIILGPQGSGKGTQGARLAKKLGIPSMVTGNLLREEIATGSEAGAYIASVIDGGTLLPDAYINQFMADKIKRAIEIGGGAVIDGYPRRVGQAEALDAIIPPTHVLEINITNEEAVKRLLLRAQAEKRVDDTEERIRYRLLQYHAETKPVFDYYRARGVLHVIDGMPDIEKVEASIHNLF